ncbi:MAG: DUF2312 domain-containing protein [Rickettsiales bacterium]|jgi:uncharacterized protein (UPF0335 family)|nr:DUF2312 domain-containing protein [Rickettsiales bacterium]
MTNMVGGVDGTTLKQIIEKIESLEEEKRAMADDIKDVMQEAKSIGFDVKVIREVLKLRKMDSNDLFELESMVEIYKKAIGMGGETSEEIPSEEVLENIA